VSGIRRRDFVILLGGGAAAAWPLVARAQHTRVPVVGLLNAGSRAERIKHLAAFREALSEAGYVEGQNVSIEYRWAEDRYDRLPALAADLIGRQVAVIATPGSTPAALAAKRATTTIPIVFSSGSDPVRLGLVASLSRPDSNLTGMSILTSLLVTKQFDLLHQLAPATEMIGLLVNPNFPDTEPIMRDAQAAAKARGQKVAVAKASAANQFDSAFTTLLQQGIGTLLVPADPLLFSRREQLVALARAHAMPAIYSLREFVDAGGLMSYGPSNIEGWRQVGVYAGRILKGEKPADLPVQQSTRFEFVINLRTAKALGLDVPDRLLALVDEVIE
jgi:ABC-type uncharacterized transport system substrate-binding protein